MSMARPRFSQICLTSAAEPSNVSRSLSMISTPSKPTVAAASSLSTREPLSATVAMDLRRGCACCATVLVGSGNVDLPACRRGLFYRRDSLERVQLTRHPRESGHPVVAWMPHSSGASHRPVFHARRCAVGGCPSVHVRAVHYEHKGLILHPLASRECCRRTCIGEGLGTHPIVVPLVNRNRIRVTEVVQVNPGGFPSAPDRDGRDDGHSEGDRPIVSGMLVAPGAARV